MTTVFLYGALLAPATLARRGGDARLPAATVPAVLPGWQRVALPGGRYPTIRRWRTGAVSGALVTLPARARARLTAYEGPAYRLLRVVVTTHNGKTGALVWIAPGGTRRPWQAKGDTPCSSHRPPAPACARTRSTRPRC